MTMTSISGIQRGEAPLRRLHFQRTHVLGAKENLPRQIGLVDSIEIVEHEPADAARAEVERRRATEAAQADDEDACTAELRLAVGADVGERDLPRVALAHAAVPPQGEREHTRAAREIVVRRDHTPAARDGELRELGALLVAVLEQQHAVPRVQMLAAPPSNAR